MTTTEPAPPLAGVVATDEAAAVVVCAHTMERLGDIAACLAGLAAQRRPADEIVCVVDHADDLRTAIDALVAEAGWRVRVVANAHRRGLSGARNTGIEATSAPLIAFIDDDAVPHRDWLAELLAPFARDDVHAAGGRIEPAWPDDRPRWFPPHLDWTVGCSIPTLPADGGSVRNMYGASAAFRRSALVAVGGFPTELGRVGADGAGCEETEVCIRIRQRVRGADVVYAPRSLVRHRVTPQRATVRYVLRRCLAEGRSKAALSWRVGSDPATADERSYALTILRSVGRDTVAGVRDPARWGRAAVLLGGLGAAAAGYAWGTVRAAPWRRRR